MEHDKQGAGAGFVVCGRNIEVAVSAFVQQQQPALCAVSPQLLAAEHWIVAFDRLAWCCRTTAGRIKHLIPSNHTYAVYLCNKVLVCTHCWPVLCLELVHIRTPCQHTWSVLQGLC